MCMNRRKEITQANMGQIDINIMANNAKYLTTSQYKNIKQ